MLLHYILLRRCMLPCRGCHRLQMQRIRHGSMGGYGCSVSRCLILHIIKGEAPGCQYMTDWDRVNLVLCSRLHRSDQSMPTGQTGLIRGRVKLLFQGWNATSRKRWRSQSPLLMQRSSKPMLLFRLMILKWLLIMWAKKIMFGKSVNSPVQRPIRANDHQAGSSSSASKHFRPRWCPPGLTRTQKRKLQHLRVQEKKEQEIQKLRDKQFNQCRPMVPQGKVWRVKSADQPARPVKPSQATGLTGTSDRSDRLE